MFSLSLASLRAAECLVVDGNVLAIEIIGGVDEDRGLVREKGFFFFPQMEKERGAETTIIPVEGRRWKMGQEPQWLLGHFRMLMSNQVFLQVFLW